MSEKKKSLISNFVQRMIVIVPAVLSLVSNLTYLVEQEAKIAKQKLALLVLLTCISMALLASIWICLLGFGFFYLIQHLSVPISLALLCAFNFLLLIIFFLLIKIKLEKLFIFDGTRNFLKQLINKT